MGEKSQFIDLNAASLSVLNGFIGLRETETRGRWMNGAAAEVRGSDGGETCVYADR